MSTAAPVGVAPTARPQRHAFGWPAGSIRALLALSVLALLWLLALRPVLGKTIGEVKLPMEFVYLQLLMVLMLAHYFAAHGGSIRPGEGRRPPLGLPRGTVRFLLVAGYLGLAAFMWYKNTDFEIPPRGPFLLLITLLVSGFFLGHVLTAIVRGVSGGVLPPAFQDIQAWIALLAIIALGLIFVVQIFINPTLKLGEQIEPATLEAILASLVGFYFGARS
jgi:hypothetical protein